MYVIHKYNYYNYLVNKTNIKQNTKWTQLKKQQTWPGKRGEHTLNYYNNNIYMFGGCDDGDNYHNSLWVYNIKTNKWINQQHKSKNNINIPKVAYHKTVIFNDNIILFGGKDDNYDHYNDIYIYNIKDNIWHKIICNNKPPKRQQHGMAISNKKLVIQGGLDDDDNALNDMYIININDIINDEKNKTWIKINTINHKVYSHLFLSFKQTKILCFGGYPYNNNLFIYQDIKKSNKQTVQIKNIKPRREHNGCLVTVNDTIYMFVMGGYNGFYFDDCYLVYLDKNNNDINENKEDESKDNNNDVINKLQNELIKIKKEYNNVNNINNDYKKQVCT